MNKKEGIISILFLVLIILVIGNINASDYCVNPVINDISPSSIGIDEEFTVGILLDNCGDLVPKSISFELKDISPDIYLKEPLIRTISNLGYVGDRFLLYHMKTSKDIKPGDYYINYKVTYSGGGEVTFFEEGNFIITVIGDKAELSIASVKTEPVLPKEKETVELTLRIENFGDGTANSIKVRLEHPFSGPKEAFIGTLDSDEDGPAVFTFIAQEGEYKIPVTISYQDDFGEKEMKTEISLYIAKSDSNIFLIAIILIIIGIIAWLIFYLLKIKKSKEKVIHQLLKEDHLEKKKIKRK